MYTQNSYAQYRQRIRDIEMLRWRCEWLGDKDRTLMQMVFENGSTFGQIARLTGEYPSTVSRRFHRIYRKLITRQLMPILRQRNEFDSRALRIIQDYYLKGIPQKSLAHKFNISLYHIRTILRTARIIAANCSRHTSQLPNHSFTSANGA